MKRTARSSKEGAGKRRSKRPVPQSAWPRHLQDLKRFRKEHGHCNVPAVYPPNRPLGRWVNYLRQQKKTGRLAKEWFACLEALGFCWVLGRGSARRLDWDVMLAALTAFTKRHGHCDVACNWPEDPRLGRWVARLRRKKREGKLDRRQIAQLNKLGIVWKPPPKPSWPEMYSALTQYERAHGNCNVPYDSAENPHLGPWVRKQRQERKAGRLDPGRIELLDKLGFVWNWLENQWESQFAALVEFRKEHGHCRVSTLSKTHAPLGNWVRTLRVRRRQGNLSAERIRRLDALGFTWEMLTPGSAGAAKAPLSPRETDVAREIARGLTNQQIAETLHISHETVKEHVQHILRKLDLADRTQAAAWAVMNGLLVNC